MIRFFWCPRTRSFRTLWLLEELGVKYEPVLTDIRNPDRPRDADFSRASPMGKVPAIRDGDVYLSDSASIGLYLADRYRDTVLAPAVDGGRDRADYIYWMLYTPGVIEPAMTEKFSGMQPNKQTYGWGDFPTMLETLASRLEGRDWIAGDAFTAADVMTASSLHFMKLFGILPETPVFDAYIERCQDRPAHARAQKMEEAHAPDEEGN